MVTYGTLLCMSKRRLRNRPQDLDELNTTLRLADTFHEHGLSLPTRTIYLGAEDEVDTEMAERFIKNLHILECLSDAPVNMILNTPGGDVYHGLAIYDAIEASPCPVTAFVRGYAMSMGSIILQAATTRLMSSHAVQMIHYGSMSMESHAKTFQKWAREAERVDAWMELMYLARIRERRPDYTLEDLRALLDHDTMLTVEASIDLGLCDDVG